MIAAHFLGGKLQGAVFDCYCPLENVRLKLRITTLTAFIVFPLLFRNTVMLTLHSTLLMAIKSFPWATRIEFLNRPGQRGSKDAKHQRQADSRNWRGVTE